MSYENAGRRRTGAQILVPALAVLIMLGAGCSEKETMTTQEAAPMPAPAPEVMEAEAPAPAEPAAAPEPAEAPAAAAPAAAEAAAEAQTAAIDGESIYKKSCQACHVAGVAGAPKTGDKDAWAPRIAKGNDALMASVTNGMNAMPPKGGCMSCSEDELRAAMEYLLEQGS